MTNEPKQVLAVIKKIRKFAPLFLNKHKHECIQILRFSRSL